ncbi:MAG TPA: GNAT family N-acetyltransferase [Bryobacteraceae bacterium]|jgi:GNAT superfamily N-acetyltransferase|nr:GNAT family N-acetyltransferase [Bryobacteraceae bacterium]
MLKIIPATERDVPLVFSFIRKLAEYEKLLDEVVATEELLREGLFGPHPAAEVVLAYLDGLPVGFALYFHTFSTFVGRPGIYLEDLFVEPTHRGLGVGKALLAYVANLAVERGCGRFEWSVLNWNTPSIDFYKSLGAVPLDDWTRYRMTADALKKLASKNSGT